MTYEQAIALHLIDVGPAAPFPSRVIEVSHTIVIGNGSAIRPCPDYGLRFIGQGYGAADHEMAPAGGATVLRWTGPAGGTVMRLAGPVCAATLRGFVIDCAGVAAVGLELLHPYKCRIQDVLVTNPANLGVLLRGVGSATGTAGMAANCGGNIFERLEVALRAPGSVGIEIGVDDDAQTMGVSQNLFIHCGVSGTGDPTQRGWRLRGCDSNLFIFPEAWNVGVPVEYLSPSTAQYPGQFPYANHTIMQYLWPPAGSDPTKWAPPLRWSANWAPDNSTVMDMPIREFAGGDWSYPPVVEHPRKPRAIIWQGVKEKDKEG